MKLLTFFAVLAVSFSLFVNVESAKKKQPRPDPLAEEYGTLGSKATFYDEELLNGYSTSIELPRGGELKCKNLPKRWKGKPRSVDTYGTCIEVCTEDECGGDCVRVYPSNGDQQLSTVGMSGRIYSMKPCF